jgi:hypothetical protein
MVQNTGVAASPQSPETGTWIPWADENHPIADTHAARLALDQALVPRLPVEINGILAGRSPLNCAALAHLCRSDAVRWDHRWTEGFRDLTSQDLTSQERGCPIRKR